MSKILELCEKRKTAWENTKNFLESKRDGSGIVSPEDTATYEKMEAEVIALTNEIERLEHQEAMDAKFSASLKAPIFNQPTNSNTSQNKTSKTSSDEYKISFWNAMRGREFIKNDLVIGTDSKGGYLVPDEFERTLVQSLEENNIMRSLARIIRTSSGEMQIPVVATRGTASWVDEATEIPTSDDSFSQVTLSAYKIGTMIKVSHELLNDSAFPLDSFIAEDFGRRMGTLEEEAFISGDGTKKPTGFLSTAQVGKTTASATAITFDDVMDLYYALKSPYRNKAVFITNDSTIKALRKVKDTNGQYIWQPSLVAGTPDTIMGRPVYVSSFMPAMSAGVKAMAFGDFSYYWIADRVGRTFERLDELFSATDQVGFKGIQRVDGKLILPEAVQVLQMANS